jgi:hypothetical protein
MRKKTHLILAVFVSCMVLCSGGNVAAQRPESTTIVENGLSSSIPDFSGNWRVINPGPDEEIKATADTDRGFSCGGLKGPNGGPLMRCQIPVDKLMPYLHPRALAWIQFASTSDEALSPRYDCAAASLPTVFGDPYITSFTRNSDKVIIHYEQSNWNREVWMDGRKHPPATELFYHGHSIGWYEGDELVIDSANFTFDPDGMDDQSHLPTSVRKHMVERYKKTGPDRMTLTITLEDSLFLRRPFTWDHKYKRAAANDQPVGIWECDVETSHSELEVMAPDKYEGR